jgi:hypothetical protein
VRWSDVEVKLFDESGKTWRLALRQVEDEPREGGGVDDRMLERALQAATDQPRVEGVVAVLDQNGALRETQKASPCVLELGRPDQHRAVDVVSLACVGVDRGAAVDEGVEEGKRAPQGEAFGADLQDEKGGVARRLHVQGHELGVAEGGLGPDLGCVDRDLLPGDEPGGAARFEEKGLGPHQRAIASARLAHAISSPLSARSRTTATA